MRSSKSRSRGKSNRNRNPGNNLNRVFDSSGPEGKVRGTPQQIIDKYTQLARDATLSNDRVAAENFLQHAEHYTRLLNEAQRSAEAKRQQAEQQNRDRQQREREEREARIARQEAAAANPPNDPSDMPQPSFQPATSGEAPNSEPSADSGLVETPESKPKRPPRARKPRAKPPAKPKAAKTDQEAAPAPAQPKSTGESPEAAE
ncbi:MAG TPA: DUF4167 domain-containing protein [Aliiroseovarius sp.]|nr:DUF4167 domain-containing protein [Aliiroseovarius sp.]